MGNEANLRQLDRSESISSDEDLDQEISFNLKSGEQPFYNEGSKMKCETKLSGRSAALRIQQF
jgi:hypothetical protein